MMTDTWPLAPSQGFLNFPLKKKYLGGDSVSGKAVHVWNFFQNLFSQNDLPDLDSLVQIKNRDTNRVRTTTRRPHAGASTVSGDSAGDFRDLDSNS